MYEQNRHKNRRSQKKSGKKISNEADEFWKKVNESLILAPKNYQEEESVSKEFQEIYETFVTE